MNHYKNTPPPTRPPSFRDPGFGLNGSRLCFCGVWVSARTFHKLLTGHAFLAASDAMFTPGDHARGDVLVFPGPLTQEEVKGLRERWEALHGKGGAL